MLGEARDLGVTVRDLASQHGLSQTTPRSPRRSSPPSSKTTSRRGQGGLSKVRHLAKEAVAHEQSGTRRRSGRRSSRRCPTFFMRRWRGARARDGARDRTHRTHSARWCGAHRTRLRAADRATDRGRANRATSRAAHRRTRACARARAAGRPFEARRAWAELLPLAAPPPGKMLPAPMHGMTPEAWTARCARCRRPARRNPPGERAQGGGRRWRSCAPPPVPEKRVYDPETIHYAKQYYAKIAKLGVLAGKDEQGGFLATQAHGAAQLWEAARQDLRADPLWAKADDVFANQSRHIDMTELGRNLTKIHSTPRAAKRCTRRSMPSRRAWSRRRQPSKTRFARRLRQTSPTTSGGRLAGGVIKKAGNRHRSGAGALHSRQATRNRRPRPALRSTPSRPMPPELGAARRAGRGATLPAAAARRLGVYRAHGQARAAGEGRRGRSIATGRRGATRRAPAGRGPWCAAAQRPGSSANGKAFAGASSRPASSSPRRPSVRARWRWRSRCPRTRRRSRVRQSDRRCAKSSRTS